MTLALLRFAVLASILNYICCDRVDPSTNAALEFIANVDGKTFYADASRRNVNFAEALDFCHENDLHLATIESLQANNRLSDYGLNHGAAFYWLGATDYFREGTFHWLKENRRVTYNRFQRWNTLSFNCIFFSSNSGDWFYDSCSTASYKIVCETEAVVRNDDALVFV